MLKRIVCFILCLLVVLNITNGVFAADTDGLKHSRYGLFDYYAGKGINVSAVSEQELMVFGIFLSNYVKPFATGENRSYAYFKTTEGKNYVYWGQSDFEASFGKILDQLESYRISNLHELRTPSGNQMTLENLIYSYKDKKSFQLNIEYEEESVLVGDTANPYFNLGLYLSIISGAGDFDSNWGNLKLSPLFIDGFGNIIVTNEERTEDIIIIPAVLNPYVFVEDGQYVGMNAYTLANYLDLSQLYMYVSENKANTANYVGFDLGQYSKYFPGYDLSRGNVGVASSDGYGDVPELLEYADANKIITGGIFFESAIRYTKSKFSLRVADYINVYDIPDSVQYDPNSYKERFNNFIKQGSEYKAPVITGGSFINPNISSTARLKVRMDKVVLDNDSFRVLGFLWKADNDLGKSLTAMYNSFPDSLNAQKLDTSISMFDFETGEAQSISYLSAKAYNVEFLNMMINGSGVELFNGFKESPWKTLDAKYFIDDLGFALYKMNPSLAAYMGSTKIDKAQIKVAGKETAINLYYSLLELTLSKGVLNAKLVEALQSYSPTFLDTLKKSIITEFETNKSDQLSEAEKERRYGELIDNVYKLTSVNDNGYRQQLSMSTFNDFILNQHVKLTNSDASGLYLSQKDIRNKSALGDFLVGLNLHELPFTSSLMDNYKYFILIFMMIVLAVLAIQVIISKTTFKVLLANFLVICLMTVFIPVVINDSVNISNSIASQIYSDKYSYWALTQYQQYLSNVSRAASTEDKLIVSNIENMKSTQSDMGVTLKWLSPKKIDVFDQFFRKGMELNTGGTINLTIFEWMSKNYFRQEVYTADGYGIYLYRSFHDIAKTAKNAYDNYVPNIERYRSILGEKEYIFDSNVYSIYREYVPMFVDKAQHIDGWLLPGGVSTTYEYMMFRPLAMDYVSTQNVLNEDEKFLLYTESLYYYFYDVIRDYFETNRQPGQELPDQNALVSGFINFLMNEDNFYTYDDTNRYVRDFLDMENLFKNIYPYMKYQNDITKVLRETYFGTEEYDRLERDIWGRYCTWADILNNVEYKNDNQYVMAGITNNKVRDAFDYKQYQVRDMVFSEAEMKSQNISYLDLTNVELKIQNVLKKTYQDWFYMLNNLGYSEEDFIANAAMYATLNFNNEFSEKRLFNDKQLSLYPLSFELRNFNYDAYIKLALITTTGRPLVSSEDIYVNVLNSESILTGLMLLVCDLSAIIVGGFRFVLILVLFGLGILLLVKRIFVIEGSVVGFLKKVLLPIGVYMVSTIVYVLALSLFLANSLNNLVSTKGFSIYTNSALLTLLLITVLSLGYLYAMYKIIKSIAKTLYSESKLVAKFADNATVALKNVLVGTTGVIGGVLGTGAALTGALGGFLARKATGDETLFRSDDDLDRYYKKQTIREMSRQQDVYNEHAAFDYDSIVDSGASKSNEPFEKATNQPTIAPSSDSSVDS